MSTSHVARLTLACLVVCLFAPIAAGTPARAARDAQQTFNLADFGATGDGLTDDGPALQAALDAVMAAGGGTLLVPAGRYAIVTPVVASAQGPNASLEIRGVASGTPVPPPTAGGDQLSRGLDLTSEFAPKTGDGQIAILVQGFSSFLIKDIGFIGSADVGTDAHITLAISYVPDAVIRHCEFYGLATLGPGGAIIQNYGGGLTIQQSEFLGCTANSGLYTPVVQNLLWESITVEDAIFIDYGQRPELYAKTGIGSPLSWINVGHAAPPTADSSRREVVLRNIFLDEGGWQAVTALPARYQSPPVPIDLFYATGLYVNVSNFNTTGLYISGIRNVLVEDSIFTWSHRADSAVYILDAQDAILDRLNTSASATRLVAEYLTSRLTVIDSTYTDLASAAAQTIVLTPSTPDEDPVRYVRAQFESALGREPDAAAHYYWSRRLLDCGADAACLTSQRTQLAAYLATTPAPTFDLNGRATDENGQPLAGVTVTLSGTHSTATLSWLTGADGTYSFGRLPTSGTYTLTASKRHYTFTTPTRTINRPPGAQVVDFPATLNRHDIGGRLLDEFGRVIQGATLRLSGTQAATTTSDANGNYTFAGLPAGGNYTVTASSARYSFASPSQSFTDLDANRTADFAGTSLLFNLTGQLFDSTSHPLTGLSVALSGGKTATATTDALGNFVFADLPRGGGYTVTPAKLFGSLFTPASKTFNNLTADQSAVFTAVPTNYKLSGRVTSGGTGLAGVTVTLSGSKTGATTTDAAGAYSFSVPVHGDYAAAPAKTHYTFDRVSVSFKGVTADQTADFVATLDRHKLSGSVKRPNGAALAGVTVTLSGGQAATTTTDATGGYSFANVPAGAAYTITPSKPGYDFAPASKSFTDLGTDQTADFTVTPSNVSVSGRVTAGGAALAGVTVTLSGSKAGTATTDAQGNYSFTVTSEGSYTVTPSKAHYKFSPSSLSFNNPTSAQTADFAGTLDRHKISGRVVDKGNAALAGVNVSLSGAQTAAAMTDAQGNYSFTNLPAGGDYAVSASKANYSLSPAGATFKELGADSTADFTATLLDYNISGRVTSGGVGLAGVTVTLSGPNAGGVKTDAAGNYSFTVPAGGSYTVIPSLKNYAFSPQALAFTNIGGDKTADFTAVLDRHSILGRVAYVNGVGVAGVTLTLSGAQSATAVSDAQGNYSFPELPAGGNYTLAAALAHYAFAPASQTFNDLDGSVHANFTAGVVSYRIAGRVTEKGSPLAGVEVTLNGTHALLGAQSGKATTGADGAYSFNVPALGDYTVMPSKKDYAFDRPSAIFKSLASDQTADFAAKLQTVLSFAATSYAVSEGGGSLTVTVTREGDTTTEASAVYEGHGGTAKVGSDFVASIGLLTFAPGETSKTFTLFITDDGFAEGPELFTLTLAPGDGAVTGDTAVTSVTINDNDATNAAANPIDDDEFFVREQYRDFFSREPDAAGLKFWTDEIKKCGTNAQCREARRVSVSAAFFLSIEFKETGLLVYRLYRATYGRAPARVGEFMLDSRVVGDGVVVGADGWPERLAANKRAFLDEWTHRREFEERYDALDDSQFLQALFANMKVTPTEAQREALLAKLAAGATRAQVLAEVIENEQFNRQEFNRAFVLMQYFGYLRRNPNDPPDADLTGYNHWLGKLDEFGGDYEKAEMVRAFLSSIEYRGRFGN
ncbi:MAG: carboxypeptidase regulatory-like domain-containing protein [Pyrinomonadaceae bacterium]